MNMAEFVDASQGPSRTNTFDWPQLRVARTTPAADADDLPARNELTQLARQRGLRLPEQLLELRGSGGRQRSGVSGWIRPCW